MASTNLQDLLLAWYDTSKRDLPWRKTNDPYAIWVSEIMLQQTQVATVIPYWERWLTRFPTVSALAQASEEEVLSLWQGLGYYRRCRLLHQGAKVVAEQGFPTNVSAWQSVPGIGAYTAGAIASIAYQHSVPLVDGNVARVYARLTADESEYDTLLKNAWKWAEVTVPDQRPGDWNQALMELGATVCTPTQPNCQQCPVSSKCRALAWSRQNELPKPKPKVNAVKLTQDVWIPRYESKIGMIQAPEGKWWQGMWIFPTQSVTPEFENPTLRGFIGAGWLTSIGTINYAVTNHRIQAIVSMVTLEEMSSELRWFSPEDLVVLPIPAPYRKALKLLST